MYIGDYCEIDEMEFTDSPDWHLPDDLILEWRHCKTPKTTKALRDLQGRIRNAGHTLLACNLPQALHFNEIHLIENNEDLAELIAEPMTHKIFFMRYPGKIERPQGQRRNPDPRPTEFASVY